MIQAQMQRFPRRGPWVLALLLLGLPVTAQESGNSEAQAPQTESAPAIIEGKQLDLIQLQFQGVIYECQTLDERGMYEDCLNSLQIYSDKLPDSQQAEIKDIRMQLTLRRQLIEAKKTIPPLDPKNPNVHYRALFAAYLTIPEAYFPFDEVMPMWQEYMLREDARNKFKRYKTVRVLARADEEKDEPLEALFYKNIQSRFEDYGYKLVDLTTTSSRSKNEMLVKLTLSGRSLDDTIDAQVTGESLFELTQDITSIRYTDSKGKRLPPRTLTLLQRGPDPETTRREAVEILAPQVADAVFYLTLKQYFKL